MGLFNKFKEIFKKEDKKDIELYDKGLEKTRKEFVSNLSFLGHKYTKVNDEYFDELESILIKADIGVNTTYKFLDKLKKRVKEEKIEDASVLREIIIDELFMIYVDGDSLTDKINIQKEGPTVILMVGVNGVGKTTTIGKLANIYHNQGHKVMLIGADTFRAGAVPQLEEWAKRTNSCFCGKENVDPSSVIYDGLEKALKEINEKANDMSLLVNDILDISITSRKNMQIYEETYNPESLFKKLVMKFKEENNNRITFSYAIPESMPKELYGDSVKLKQIVNTVLTNAFKYTKEGYVDLKVTNINKYDIARLIITVEDTGCGMSIDKVNDILNNNKEFSKEELDNLEKINVGIKLANKLVIEMGGILVIKSEENKGTKVTIIIDEQIKEDSYNKMLEEDNYLRNTKIAILGDKTRKINKIRDLMKQYEVKTYLEKEELIEQIKKKEKYDLIILFDDMKPSGIEVLKSLKEIKGYKTPTVVLLEDNKTSIKEHYIKDGFTDYLLLSNINEEIKKLDKYLKG